ncbi:MAG: tRNA epoxyqueuosine(34) reductase QueG [Rikenellaceae bacterium]
MLLRASELKEIVSEAGFDLCGITPATHLADSEERYMSWLNSGCGTGLEYLGNYLDLRFDASRLVEGAKTVIVCAINYKSEYSLAKCDDGASISSYALMRDYHKTIKRQMKGVLTCLSRKYGVAGRLFTDSAPLLEKALAVRAGLGWIGRQSLLVTKEYGTFVLLGEIVIDAEVDCYDEPIAVDKYACGSCRKCIDSCPTQAINDNMTLDARRCIASRTIEFEDCGKEPLHGWVFGCDICQSCCPHNAKTPLSNSSITKPIISPPTPQEWKAMGQREFEEFTAGTPIRRSSIARIHRAIELNELNRTKK